MNIPFANQASWDQRESIILDFESAWQADANSPPAIGVFHQRMPQSVALLLELVKIDLEYRWKHGCGKRIEEYAEISTDIMGVLEHRHELIEEELLARQTVRQSPTREELLRRFPDDVDWLGGLIEESAIRSESVLADRSVPIRPGEKIGRYEMLEVAGQGAFADVWRAVDADLNRQVAIKVLRFSREESAGVFGRFMREARTAARLKHPSIVPVYEINQSGSRPYIVSQFVDGPTLEEAVCEERLSFAEAARIVHSLAGGLACAHKHGIVHRDIKPANVLMNDGKPMLTDFGLAHVEQQIDATLTQQGDVLGTPAYMAPEQAKGDVRRIDARTDVYALGVMLYRLSTGRLPFEGAANSVLFGVIHHQPTPIESVAGAVPIDYRTIVNKCLEKAPADRYQSAAHLARELERFLSGEPILARPIGFVERSWKWSQRRPRLAAVLAICLLLVSFLLGTLWQLRTVQRQSQRTRALMAVAAGDAGRLAMQAGHPAEAANYFLSSLRNAPDSVQPLHFSIVEAMVAARQLDRAADYFRSLSVDALPDSQRALHLLWHAELAWEGVEEGNPIALYEQALATRSLSSDEELYAQAMLANQTKEARHLLNLVLQENAFHDRARKRQIASLLTMADYEAADGLAVASQQLFPENDSYIGIATVTKCLCEEYDKSQALLTDLDRDSADAWLQVFRVVKHLHAFAKPDNIALPPPQFYELQQACRTLKSFGFQLAPKIQRRYESLVQSLADEPRDMQVVERQLGAILEYESEASLYQLAATGALARDDWDAALELATQARKIDRSFLKLTRSEACKTICAIAAFRMGKTTDENERMKYLGAFRDAVDDIDFSGQTPAQVRVFVLGAMMCEDYQLADSIASQFWNKGSDALWHRAIIARNLNRFDEAVRLSDELVAADPDNPSYRGLRESIVERIRASLEAYESSEPPANGKAPAKSGRKPDA